MKQYRDKLQLRTQRTPAVPPIEAFSPTEGAMDTWVVILAVLSAVLVLLLAVAEWMLGRAL
jgi:hypothetical protein